MNKLMLKQILGVAGLLAASTSMAATVTIVASNSNPNIGDNFTLTIHGDGFPETAGGTFGLSLNSSVVSYVSGALPASGPFSSGSFYLPHPSTGTPTTFDILGPSSGTLPSGSFDALILTFHANANGAANIQIIDNSITDGAAATLAWFDANTADPIPTSYTQANVTVGQAVPVPAAAWLVAPAVLAAGRFSRRRKAA